MKIDQQAAVKRAPAHVLRGRQTKGRILDVTVEVATSEGLQALTISRIASACDLAKAGLLGHFKSKEELQIATVMAGRGDFARGVVEPSFARAEGGERLGFLLRSWIRSISNAPGGCFLASVAAEYDSRPGPVREAIANVLREWISTLTRLIDDGKMAADFHNNFSSAQLAFELHGHELSLNLQRQLLDSASAQSMAEKAMKASVMRFTTESGAEAFGRGWRAAALTAATA